MKDLLKYAALLCALITVSALVAHLLELPNKMGLSRDDYQTVQSIYSGWAWLGIAEIGAIPLTLAWAVMERQKKIRSLLLTASACFMVSLVIFFIFTFPANNVTMNWTDLPANWRKLRVRWEYSHAFRALVNLFGCYTLIVVLFKEKNRATILNK